MVVSTATELASDILSRRTTLVKRVNEFELAVFAAQTNNKKSMLTSDELKAALDGIVEALDAVIAKMACQKKDDGTDRRWRSGACEILPLRPDLRQLAY